jgi:hypothetical protein
VRTAVEQILRFWLDKGVDGPITVSFRLSVVRVFGTEGGGI